jgi:hypothetical protein
VAFLYILDLGEFLLLPFLKAAHHSHLQLQNQCEKSVIFAP